MLPVEAAAASDVTHGRPVYFFIQRNPCTDRMSGDDAIRADHRDSVIVDRPNDSTTGSTRRDGRDAEAVEPLASH